MCALRAVSNSAVIPSFGSTKIWRVRFAVCATAGTDITTAKTLATIVTKTFIRIGLGHLKNLCADSRDIELILLIVRTSKQLSTSGSLVFFGDGPDVVDLVGIPLMFWATRSELACRLEAGHFHASMSQSVSSGGGAVFGRNDGQRPGECVTIGLLSLVSG